MEEYYARLLKMLGILTATIIIFLALLHFRISFGIALFAAMAVMGFGINYVRRNDPKEEEADADSSIETDEING